MSEKSVELCEEDWACFRRLTSVELSEAQRRLAARPDRTEPEAEEFMALHWHPEWVPLELIDERLRLAFPEAVRFLAVPTQHNKILSFRGWAGVEADVYDRAYGLKVQLLIHFPADRLPRATALHDMLERTWLYRSRQLMDILEALGTEEQWREAAVGPLGLEAAGLARVSALKLKALIEQSGLMGGPASEMLKNRLLPDFIAARQGEDSPLLAAALAVVKAVKKKVKARLRPEAFYSPQELIEEARGLGAGVIIPHPPQFWPILLSDLDVDGWEIWNPSTPNHSLFLLQALTKSNESRRGRRQLLAFMGDDTHMSAKLRPGGGTEKDSASREIGFQDPWFEPAVASALSACGQSRSRTLSEYAARMA